MVNVFVNGLNSRTGGGKKILSNYVSELKHQSTDTNYYILTPNKSEYIKYEKSNISIIDLSNFYKRNIFYPYVYRKILPSLLDKLNIHTVFNLGDIPIKTGIRQIMLFDWPYAVYPDSVVWSKMDLKSRFTRRVKLKVFKTYLKYVDTFIVQTDSIGSKLKDLYSVKSIEVIPTATTTESNGNINYYDFNLPDGIKLLYPTYYYPHKNLEIFIPLAKEIKSKNYPYKIITTIDAEQDRSAKEFLNQIKSLKINDVIINVGSVKLENMHSLYQQCDGLLMPTLLETFGIPYIEAMQHRIPIFTSDMDFAHAVCGDAARYFDPMDHKSILLHLNSVFEDKSTQEELIRNSVTVLEKIPTWKEVIQLFNALIMKNQ